MRYSIEGAIPMWVYDKHGEKAFEMQRNELMKCLIDIIVDGKVHCFRYHYGIMQDLATFDHKVKQEIKHIDIVSILEEERKALKPFFWETDKERYIRIGGLQVIDKILNVLGEGGRND